MNNLAKRLTGAIDYAGRKCYEIIEGRDKPCENCYRSKLTDQNALIRREYYPARLFEMTIKYDKNNIPHIKYFYFI